MATNKFFNTRALLSAVALVDVMRKGVAVQDKVGTIEIDGTSYPMVLAAGTMKLKPTLAGLGDGEHFVYGHFVDIAARDANPAFRRFDITGHGLEGEALAAKRADIEARIASGEIKPRQAAPAQASKPAASRAPTASAAPKGNVTVLIPRDAAEKGQNVLLNVAGTIGYLESDSSGKASGEFMWDTKNGVKRVLMTVPAKYMDAVMPTISKSMADKKARVSFRGYTLPVAATKTQPATDMLIVIGIPNGKANEPAARAPVASEEQQMKDVQAAEQAAEMSIAA